MGTCVCIDVGVSGQSQLSFFRSQSFCFWTVYTACQEHDHKARLAAHLVLESSPVLGLQVHATMLDCFKNEFWGLNSSPPLCVVGSLPTELFNSQFLHSSPRISLWMWKYHPRKVKGTFDSRNPL